MNKLAFAKIFLLVLAFMMGFMTSNIYADSSSETSDNFQNNAQQPSPLIDLGLNNRAILTDGRTDEVPSPSS
ncbi:MAG TPA: hypothetical protein V6C58_27815, partial [Allocoleopsis sp.]